MTTSKAAGADDVALTEDNASPLSEQLEALLESAPAYDEDNYDFDAEDQFWLLLDDENESYNGGADNENKSKLVGYFQSWMSDVREAVADKEEFVVSVESKLYLPPKRAAEILAEFVEDHPHLS